MAFLASILNVLVPGYAHEAVGLLLAYCLREVFDTPLAACILQPPCLLDFSSQFRTYRFPSSFMHVSQSFELRCMDDVVEVALLNLFQYLGELVRELLDPFNMFVRFFFGACFIRFCPLRFLTDFQVPIFANSLLLLLGEVSLRSTFFWLACCTLPSLHC